MLTKKISRIAVALALIIAAPLAMADDCTKPKVKGYSADDMSCIGEGLVRIWNDDGVVVFDENGKTIASNGQYLEVFEFSEGLAGVVDLDYKTGYIDKTGKVIIPLIYAPTMAGEGGEFLMVNLFKEGLAAVAKQDNDGNEKWGFIDKTGKTIIPFTYAFAGDFGSGMAPVAVEKINLDYSEFVWNYIDKSGETVISSAFDYAAKFFDGAAVVMKNDKYGVIDTKGVIIVPYKYDYIDEFYDGLAAVFIEGKPLKDSDSIRGKYGFIDRTGKVVIPI